MLKAITFDFWQTLYADSYTNWQSRQAVRVRLCHRYLVECGYSRTPTEVAAGLDTAYDLTSIRWHQHLGVAVETCMEEFAKTLALSLDETEISALVSFLGAAFLEAPPILIPHVKSVLARLSENYPLGIISDSALTPGSFARQLMARDGILEFFTAFTFSDETAHTKPEVVQFYSTLKQLNAEPSEAVHIGDIFRTDIVGAKNAGMKAIRFTGFNKTETNDTLSDAVVDDYRQLEAAIAELSK